MDILKQRASRILAWVDRISNEMSIAPENKNITLSDIFLKQI